MKSTEWFNFLGPGFRVLKQWGNPSANSLVSQYSHPAGRKDLPAVSHDHWIPTIPPDRTEGWAPPTGSPDFGASTSHRTQRKVHTCLGQQRFPCVLGSDRQQGCQWLQLWAETRNPEAFIMGSSSLHLHTEKSTPAIAQSHLGGWRVVF